MVSQVNKCLLLGHAHVTPRLINPRTAILAFNRGFCNSVSANQNDWRDEIIRPLFSRHPITHAHWKGKEPLVIMGFDSYFDPNTNVTYQAMWGRKRTSAYNEHLGSCHGNIHEVRELPGPLFDLMAARISPQRYRRGTHRQVLCFLSPEEAATALSETLVDLGRTTAGLPCLYRTTLGSSEPTPFTAVPASPAPADLAPDPPG